MSRKNCEREKCVKREKRKQMKKLSGDRKKFDKKQEISDKQSRHKKHEKYGEFDNPEELEKLNKHDDKKYGPSCFKAPAQGPTGPTGPIGITGSTGPTGPSINTCDLNTLDVSPCSGDTIYFHSEVAATPLGTNSYSVFKAADNISPILTDVTLVIEPRGNGALVTRRPDSSIANGNARGTNAVDLQMRRLQPTQVAGGRSAVIGGGENNSSFGNLSVANGGYGNNSSGHVSVNCGGEANITSNNYASNLGGRNNNVSGEYATNGGGQANNSSGSGAVNGGGSSNVSSSFRSTVGGGQGNISSNNFSTTSGGQGNEASGQNSTIPGGIGNKAGANGSFAAGSSAQALHEDGFVWSVTQQTLNYTQTNAVRQAVFNLKNTAYVPSSTSPETFYINGDLVVEGNISGTSNSFLIDHPIYEDKSIRHMCVESPKSDVIYRGQVQLINGRAEVDIDVTAGMTDTTFSKLTKNHQVYLTNKTKNNWDLVKVDDMLSTGKFVIVSNNDKSDAIVDWLLIAERIVAAEADK